MSVTTVRELIQYKCSYCVCFWTGKLMASTDLERRLVLVWPLLLTGLMDLQVDGKYRLGKKIGSGMTPLTD
jgi:hypothetical protein